MWLIGIGVAHAGFAIGGVVGADIPTRSVSSLDPGPAFGVLVGYRVDLAVLHLQPEVQAIYSTVTPGIGFNIGAAATVLSPLAFGAAVHAGISPGNGPTWDALGVIEVTMIPKLRPGIRAGVQNVNYSGVNQLYGQVQGVLVVVF